MIKPHSRVRVEQLVALIGSEATARICHFGGGRRLPRYAEYQAWERRVLLIKDWLDGGYTQRHLAEKYQLSPTVVKKIIRAIDLKRIEAWRATRRASG